MPTSPLASSPPMVAAVFQALSDENRLRIVEVLQDGERCVCDIQSALELGQSLLSHHLKVLREARLVRARREGRWVHYALSDEGWAVAEEWVSEKWVSAGAEPPRRSTC